MPHPRLFAANLCAFAVLVFSAQARADLSTDETPPTPARSPAHESGTRPTGTRDAAAPADYPNRSVELLLQLQDRADLTTASARKTKDAQVTATMKAQGASPGVEPVDAAANALKQLKTAVLSDRPQSSGTSSTSRTGGGATGDSQSGSKGNGPTDQSAGGSDTASEATPPHPAVRFLRENRTSVLTGCGVLLGLIGLATVLAGRRR